MFRSCKICSFLVFLIAFGGVASIALYLIINSFFTPDSSLESTELQQMIRTFEHNEELVSSHSYDTTTWNIYTNDELNFEISYPGTLDFEEYDISKSDDYVVETIVQFTPQLLPGDAANQPTIGIDTKRDTDFLSIDQWIRSLETNLKDEGSLISIEKTVVNGINAVKVITEGERGNTINYSLFPENNENIIYDIAFLEGGGSSLMPDPITIFESMLQTFKFID